jgi:hypothetical protein
MTFVRGVFDEIVQRRLWPLAAGLLVALVAVPLLLSGRGGSETASAPANATTPTSPLIGRESAALLGETQPVVSLTDRRPFRRKLAHFPRKNPFVQQAQPKTAPASESLSTVGGDSGSVKPDTFSGGVPTSAPGTGYVGPPTVKERKFVYTVSVEFGEIGDTSIKTLDPTDSLPNDHGAVVIYLGSDGKSALFLAKSGVTARGDGSCEPSESDCAILRMRKGDVEFFEVATGGDSVTTYQLELTSIQEKTVTSMPSGLGDVNHESATPGRSRFHELGRAERIFDALSKLGG